MFKYFVLHFILHCRYFFNPGGFLTIFTAAGADYDNINRTVVFPAMSDTRIMCVNITIFGDDIIEGEENFLISLLTTDLTVTLATAEVSIADEGMAVKL